MDKVKFGNYLKEMRIKKNYTQQQLADLLFVDVTTVSKWERGVSYPDITMIPDICKALEISEHELIVSSRDEEYRKIKKDANRYNNMKKKTFWTLNIGYLLAILICFIVNVAVNHTLSWFFIVMASLLCSYTFIPTLTWTVNKHKGLVFIGTTFLSLFFLFLTCSLYSNNYWFIIATLGVLLGYFSVLYPIFFKRQKNYLSLEKYEKLSKWFLFTYLMGMFVIIVFLLISIYGYVSFNLKLAFLIAGGIFMIPIGFGILNLFSISKTLNKPLLFSLLVIFVALILCGIGRAIYFKSTAEVKTYMIDQPYNNIQIEVDTADIHVYLSDNNENKIVYIENKKINIETKVIDGVLTVNQLDNRKFYDMLFDFTRFEINLYLSQTSIDQLNITMTTGDIEIDKGFILNNVDITGSTGDIELKSNISNTLNIQNSTGDIEIENVVVDGELIIESRTGSIELDKVNCNTLKIVSNTGDTTLEDVIVEGDFNMEGSTGDLELNGFDAHNIYVTLSTGNVKGTIITEKIFNVRSNTGRVDTPETYNGGICKITVSTGDIIIKYK